MSLETEIRITYRRPREVKKAIIKWLDENHYEIFPSWYLLPPWFQEWYRRSGVEAFLPNLIAQLPVPEKGRIVLRIMIRKDRSDTVVSSEYDCRTNSDDRFWVLNWAQNVGYDPDTDHQLRNLANEEKGRFLEFLKDSAPSD